MGSGERMAAPEVVALGQEARHVLASSSAEVWRSDSHDRRRWRGLKFPVGCSRGGLKTMK